MTHVKIKRSSKITTNTTTKKKKYDIKGKLIIVEGIDGSGKSTQIHLLDKWLKFKRIPAFLSEWNSSVIVKNVTSRGKKKEQLTPTTFSLLHATDFADRYERNIFPLLRAGYIVLADRYIYSLLARDAVRKINRIWSFNLYGFAIKPDLVFYLDVEPNELIRRAFQKSTEELLKGIFDKDNFLDYYESGEDMGFSDDLLESFILYQKKIKQEFTKIQKKYGIIKINGNRTVEEVHTDLIQKIDQFLTDYKNKYGFSSIIILSSIGLSIISTGVLIYTAKL